MVGERCGRRKLCHRETSLRFKYTGTSAARLVIGAPTPRILPRITMGKKSAFFCE